MNTASRLMIALGLLLVTTGGLGRASTAEAQDVEITGPLAGAPAVRHMRIYRDGRFQLQPTVGFTINDEFARSMMVGLQAGYHFTDWLGIHAFFNFAALSLDTDLTDQVSKRGQSTDNNRLSLPTAAGFKDQIGRINYLTGIQATFIPLRGKLAMFQALFVDTDFYLFGGVAFAGVTERADVIGDFARQCSDRAIYGMGGQAGCEATQRAESSRMAIAPTFGVGLSMYFTDYMALTMEYRAFPFKYNTSGTDEGGLGKNRRPDASGTFPDNQINESDRTSQFNQMFSLGLAFYLPTKSDLTE